MSHLTRGAWIEILAVAVAINELYRRTSHEVRGLKYLSADTALTL